MAVYQTYQQIGRAEDVSDVITNIAPTDTPFQSSLRMETVDQTQFQWQEDGLDAAADNKRVEGADAPTEAHTPTAMRSNYTQILAKTVFVAATAERVKKYGRRSELAYQMAKKGKEIKRDLEFSFVGISNAAVAGDSTTAREMASYDNLVDSSGKEDAGTAAPLTETMLLNVMKRVYDNGGEASIFMIKPADASIVAGFAAVADTRIRDFGTGKKVVNAVNVYVSPWGEVKVVMNRFLLTSMALAYDPSYWRHCVLRPWKRVPLAITGDAEKHMIVGEHSLKHTNFKASGLIFDLA